MREDPMNEVNKSRIANYAGETNHAPAYFLPVLSRVAVSLVGTSSAAQ